VILTHWNLEGGLTLLGPNPKKFKMTKKWKKDILAQKLMFYISNFSKLEGLLFKTYQNVQF
jgi:hypothetical protein